MNSNIFRKSSIERLSTPEQLNEHIKLINPRSWWILAGFIAVFVFAIIWAFAGSIAKHLEFDGVAFSSADSKPVIYAYLPYSKSTLLSEDVDVRISPDYAAREKYGYIHGIIEKIGTNIISVDDLVKKYGNLSFVSNILPKDNEGNYVEVTILPLYDGNNLWWSDKDSSNIAILNGAYCDLEAVLGEQKPYQIVFGR